MSLINQKKILQSIHLPRVRWVTRSPQTFADSSTLTPQKNTRYKGITCFHIRHYFLYHYKIDRKNHRELSTGKSGLFFLSPPSLFNFLPHKFAVRNAVKVDPRISPSLHQVYFIHPTHFIYFPKCNILLRLYTWIYPEPSAKKCYRFYISWDWYTLCYYIHTKEKISPEMQYVSSITHNTL